MNSIESYIYGLLITDGNLSLSTRNRGRVILEISEKDEDIIDKLLTLIPNSHKRFRTRNTNFKKGYKCVIFVNYRKEFRDKLICEGFPIENKTINADVPITSYGEPAFWRGVIDGDGSIGWYFCRRSRANVSGGLKIISLQMFQLLKCFHLRLKSHRYR